MSLYRPKTTVLAPPCLRQIPQPPTFDHADHFDSPAVTVLAPSSLSPADPGAYNFRPRKSFRLTGCVTKGEHCNTAPEKSSGRGGGEIGDRGRKIGFNVWTRERRYRRQLNARRSSFATGRGQEHRKLHPRNLSEYVCTRRGLLLMCPAGVVYVLRKISWARQAKAATRVRDRQGASLSREQTFTCALLVIVPSLRIKYKISAASTGCLKDLRRTMSPYFPLRV